MPQLSSLANKAEAVDQAARNLAITAGVFHGINDVVRKARLRGRPSHAIGSIQFDLIQIMIIRVCALCDEGRHPDDASMPVLLKALEDEAVAKAIVENDKRWRARHALGTSRHDGAAAAIRSLKLRWAHLKRHDKALQRLRHGRNKRIGHTTTGYQTANNTTLRELWKLTDRALSVAGHIQLVFRQTNVDYEEISKSMYGDGRALIEALTSNANSSTRRKRL